MVKAREPEYKLPPLKPRASIKEREDDYTSQHGRLKRADERERLRRIDYSLLNKTVDSLEVVEEICTCRACQGKYKMCAWPKMNTRVWGEKRPACVHRVMFQMSRLSLLLKQPINPFIHTQIKERFFHEIYN